MEKRFKIILAVYFIFILGLCTRMLYLQVFDKRDLAGAASAQRIASSGIDQPRGDILDRNGIRFTNRNPKSTAVIKPLLLRGKDDESRKISNALGLDFYELKSEIEFKSEPILRDLSEKTKNSLESLNIPEVSIINSLARYDDTSLARHVLGYLNKVDMVGETGVEKYYEDLLQYAGNESVGAVRDARNNLIKGMGYRLSTAEETAKLNVKLTLDYHIQEIVERSMRDRLVTGAVVVEDVNTGDIVAMASKPDYDQNGVEYYLNSTGNELFNRAVASYNLGSIFKIVDVAALLQSDGFHPAREYYCPGYAQIGDVEFKCASYSAGGNGWVNLQKAFAQSCNTYFIYNSTQLGAEALLNMATRLGMGSGTGIDKQGVEESSGRLPNTSRYFTTGDVANIAIGQGDVLATPVQVADLVATIANGGIKNQVNIVDSIVDMNGNKVKDIRVKKGERVIPKTTAESIKDLMEEVTAVGTGTNARLEAFGGAGGKTGSAETGQYAYGSKVVHAWFAGYFPLDEPKYSIAVFVENGQNGGHAAAPVFEDIAEEIMKKGF